MTVNPVDSIHFDEETVCAGGEYEAHGFQYTAEYTTTGYVHYDTIRTQNANGCDSIVTLILTVNPVDSIHFDEETVCAGGEYAAHGFNYTAEYTTTGYVHYDTIRTNNANGCDSIVTLILTVNPVDSIHFDEETVCAGGEYAAHGFNTNNENGCDSIVTLILTVNPVDSIHFDEETVCAGGEYAAHGFNYTAEYTTTGYVHYDTIRTNNENGCDSIVTLILVVNPEVVMDQPADVTLCHGDMFEEVELTSDLDPKVSYSWSHSANAASIGVTSLTGTGNVASFMAFNTGNAPVVDTVTIIPTLHDNGIYCQGAPVLFTITVNPKAKMDGLVNQTICSNTTIDTVRFTSDLTGGVMTYTWTRNTVNGITGRMSGTGDIDTLVLTNTTNTPLTTTFTVVPTFTFNGVSCGSNENVNFTVTVNPAAQVNPVADQMFCNGSNTEEILFTTNRTGDGTTTYAWTHTRTDLGLSAVSGVGDIASFQAVNSGTAPATDTLIVTPTFTNNNEACVGTPDTFLITVNPTFEFTLRDTICEGDRYQKHGQDTIPVRPQTLAANLPFDVELSHTFQTVNQCDSVVNVILHVRPAVHITVPTLTQVCPNRDTLTLKATISPIVVDQNTLVQWKFFGQQFNHQNTVTLDHSFDTLLAHIPVKCDTLLTDTVRYRDAYCEALARFQVKVVDVDGPVVMGNLPDLTVEGCSEANLPAPYATVEEMNLIENFNISDNCTPVNELRLAYEDRVVSSTCSTSVVRTYTITDNCNGTATASQNIVIKMTDRFTITNVPKVDTVYCESMATEEFFTLPEVKDACDHILDPVDPEIATAISQCGGTKKFTYTYQNCVGDDTTWTFTYYIQLPEEMANVPRDRNGFVTCLIDVTRPKADTILDACYRRIIPEYIDSTAVLHNDGTGTVTFRYKYTDCAGHDSIWKYIYTINPETFQPRENDTIKVFCVSAIQLPPLPSITNCGTEVELTPSENTSTLSDGCGDSTFVYTYVVNAVTYTWSYTYRVEPADFSITAANGRDTVDCAGDIHRPTLPQVTDYCGRVLTPVDSTIPTTLPDCEGSVVYRYFYEDCAGNRHEWNFTYVVELPALTIPELGRDTVLCLRDTVAPRPDTLLDACGRRVVPNMSGTPTVNVAANGHGTVTFHYTYKDCANNSYPWSFTYVIIPEKFNEIADKDTTVHCVGDIPTEPVKPVIEVCGKTITLVRDSVVNHTEDCGERIFYYSYSVNDTAHYWKYTYNIHPEDFRMPANQELAVNCYAQATASSITLPTVKDSCGNVLTPGDYTKNDGNYNGCQGDVVFTYPYTDCAGHTHNWTFTYHVVMPEEIAAVPADGSRTVGCWVDVKRPAVDTIYDVCHNRIVPVFVDSVAKTRWDGMDTVIYRYQYTDCAGLDSIWKFTYYIVPGEFTPVEDSVKHVACLSNIHEPVTPQFEVCEIPVNVLYDSVHAATASCDSAIYYYHYVVNGRNYVWKYIYVVSPAPFTVPADSVAKVQCLADVTLPIPPVVTNNCSTNIEPVLTRSDTTFNDCQGTVVFTFTYNDCTLDHAKNWKMTYQIKDTIKPEKVGHLQELAVTGCNTSVVPEAVTTVEALQTMGVTVSDNCTADDELTVTNNGFSLISSGCVIEVLRVYTVTDICGNYDTLHQTIKIHRSGEGCLQRDVDPEGHHGGEQH